MAWKDFGIPRKDYGVSKKGAAAMMPDVGGVDNLPKELYVSINGDTYLYVRASDAIIQKPRSNKR